MAQIVEFPAPTGETLTVRLLAKGSDTISHTASSITGKTNDSSQYRVTDVDDSLSGDYRISAIDSNSVVVFGGWVRLTGVASAVHYADTSLAAIEAAN